MMSSLRRLALVDDVLRLLVGLTDDVFTDPLGR